MATMKYRRAKNPYTIIRRIRGEVDDVVISGDLFRMEQMDKDAWWLAIYRGNERVSFDLWWDKKRKEILVAVQDDGLGCVDDTEATS